MSQEKLNKFELRHLSSSEDEHYSFAYRLISFLLSRDVHCLTEEIDALISQDMFSQGDVKKKVCLIKSIRESLVKFDMSLEDVQKMCENLLEQKEESA